MRASNPFLAASGLSEGGVTPVPEVAMAMCREASLAPAGRGLCVFPSGGDLIL